MSARATSSSAIPVARSSQRSIDHALRYRLGTVGVHIAVNSLAVVAVLDALHLPLEAATKPLAGITPPVGRGARTVLKAGDGSILLIDESYNANPASMRAAIAVLGAVSRNAYPRRVAVLGDMLELGDGAERYHLGLADSARGIASRCRLRLRPAHAKAVRETCRPHNAAHGRRTRQR